MSIYHQFKRLFSTARFIKLPPSQRLTPYQALTLQAAEKIRASPFTTPLEKDRAILNMITTTEHNIILHASHRVDLFFLLLVAVYGSKAIVNKGLTPRGIRGANKETGTHFCHSSLFPCVRLKFPEQTETVIDSLNATVELPQAVNGFDGHLEGRKKPSSLIEASTVILNQVSQEVIDPGQGMTPFFENLHMFFMMPHTSYFNKNSQTSTSQAKQHILAYQIKGSFLATDASKRTVSDEYLHKMLGLMPDEIQALKKNPEKMKDYYKRAQNDLRPGRT
jgi:hypothetical protein